MGEYDRSMGHDLQRKRAISQGVAEFHRIRRIEEHPYMVRAAMDNLTREQRAYWMTRYIYEEDPDTSDAEVEGILERCLVDDDELERMLGHSLTES